MATVPLNGAPGFRMMKDLFEIGRRGGLMYFPYSAVIEGLSASLAAISNPAPNATPRTHGVVVTAGSAYLDGEVAKLASGVTFNFTPSATELVSGLNEYVVYLNPTRKVLTGVHNVTSGSMPTTLLNGDAISNGDYYAKVFAIDDYEVVDKIYKRTNGAWLEYDVSFAPPMHQGRGYIWGNEMYPKVTASNFSLTEEKDIYHGNLYPPYTNSNSLAELRRSASLEIARVGLYYVLLPLVITGTVVDGTDVVTISQKDYETLALITGAAGSVGAAALRLAEDVTLSTTAADRNITALTGGATPSITLAANAVADGTNVLLTVVPQTTGNNYCYIPGSSSLQPTQNFTRQ